MRVTAATAASPLAAFAALLPRRSVPAERRTELVADAAAELRTAAADTVVVIDDAHLLDDVSADALHLAVARAGWRWW